ncbi:MAG: aminomethyl transferase family protein [Halobellus sp.]|uniref:aminomethyl transferase family protein n=1 Tax=Halobellus sp. TaxID=1979212 RepID=UPI0035D49F90
MSDRTLADVLEAAASEVDLLRDLGLGNFTNVPDEYTHWIEEQRAWQESVALADQSYHMTDLRIEGREAIDLYSDYAVNDFSQFDVGQAKQLVVANPDGYLIGDAILFREAEDQFLSVGAAAAHNWLDYQAATGAYDIDVEMQPRPAATGDDPNNFRYQVQGPDAVDVMAEAVDGDLPDLSFFRFGEISIDGVDAYLLRHGMAGEAGFEFWGDYDDAETVKQAVLDAGEDYGIRRLGGKSYQSANVVLGWLPLPLPAIYSGEEMQDFREWLSVRRGLISIGGSYDSDDVEDYYVTPIEVGYDHIIDFDHDFVGKAALQAEMDDPERKKVTLVWDDEDVVDVFASLFREGASHKFMNMPTPRSSACHYDEVTKDGEHVGVSKWMSYLYNHREMLSLALVDTEYAEPGTEVTLTWGEADGSGNDSVERHVEREISATVAKAPYKQDRR